MTVAVYFQAGLDQHLFTFDELYERDIPEMFQDVGDVRLTRNVFAIMNNKHDEELEMAIYKAIDDEINKGETV